MCTCLSLAIRVYLLLVLLLLVVFKICSMLFIWFYYRKVCSPLNPFFTYSRMLSQRRGMVFYHPTWHSRMWAIMCHFSRLNEIKYEIQTIIAFLSPFQPTEPYTRFHLTAVPWILQEWFYLTCTVCFFTWMECKLACLSSFTWWIVAIIQLSTVCASSC